MPEPVLWGFQRCRCCCCHACCRDPKWIQKNVVPAKDYMQNGFNSSALGSEVCTCSATCAAPKRPPLPMPVAGRAAPACTRVACLSELSLPRRRAGCADHPRRQGQGGCVPDNARQGAPLACLPHRRHALDPPKKGALWARRIASITSSKSASTNRCGRFWGLAPGRMACLMHAHAHTRTRAHTHTNSTHARTHTKEHVHGLLLLPAGRDCGGCAAKLECQRQQRRLPRRGGRQPYRPGAAPLPPARPPLLGVCPAFRFCPCLMAWV